MEASGWTEYCRLCDEQGVGILSGKRQSKELQDMSDKVHARMTEMERSFAQEDELMMIRLIRLRDRLYT
jgi:hypothetical protein